MAGDAVGFAFPEAVCDCAVGLPAEVFPAKAGTGDVDTFIGVGCGLGFCLGLEPGFGFKRASRNSAVDLQR